MVQENGTYAIDLHHVAKRYRGKVQALRGIDMQVRGGEIFGLLGPNGAGKSTLVKIMMTVVRPTKANGTMLGRPVGHKPTLARVGYLPEHHRFPPYLTGRQALHFYGALAKVDRKTRNERIGHLLHLVNMADWADKKVSTYSKGMMQRIGLAQALINEPDIVVLDEPTDGLDPVGRREVRDVLVKMKQRGKTVFLNSHLLSELEMVCDRVAILVQGLVAMQGTLDELTAESRRYEIVIDGSQPNWIGQGEHKNLRAESHHDGQVKIIVPGAEPKVAQPIIDRLRQDNVMIRSVQPVRETLEDLFMRAIMDPQTGQARKPGAARSQATGVRA